MCIAVIFFEPWDGRGCADASSPSAVPVVKINDQGVNLPPKKKHFDESALIT